MPIPSLISRDAWGASPSQSRFERHTIDRITIHHTAVAIDDRPAPERLRAYQRYHLQQGWPDLAYHLLISEHGQLYEGRSFELPGDSATDYDSTGHLLVALDGDFTRASPPGPQLEALVETLVWAATTFQVDPGTIRGHCDHAATACPGERLAALLADRSLLTRVQQRLAAR